MTLAIHRFFAINLTCSSTAAFIASFPSSSLPRGIIMSSSSKRGALSSNDKSTNIKKAKQQQSLTGFFTSSKSKADDNDDSSSYKYKIFCDLDGVLVDFDSGVKSLFNGRSPDEVPVGTMWGRISSTPNFYANLPWTSDGQILWKELVRLPSPPDILTGVPRNHQSRAEKFQWCQRELVSVSCCSDSGESSAATTTKSLVLNHVDMAGKRNTHEIVSGRKRKGKEVINVITCWSRNKHFESKKNNVLIDDRISLREAWEGNGGIFVHHTSAERTLEVLRERGILGDDNGGD